MIRILVIAGLFAWSACSDSSVDSGHDETKSDAELAKPTPKIVVVSRTPGAAACEQCHQHVEDPVASQVKAHSEIRVKHMPDATCESCHHPEKPSWLRLASGKAVNLDESHILCGQCHSRETADWSVGIHGKQTGNWQTEIHRYGCTSCHDAHKPAFGSMQAIDPPPFPSMGIPKGGH
jgi:hypothetical protein